MQKNRLLKNLLFFIISFLATGIFSFVFAEIPGDISGSPTHIYGVGTPPSGPSGPVVVLERPDTIVVPDGSVGDTATGRRSLDRVGGGSNSGGGASAGGELKYTLLEGVAGDIQKGASPTLTAYIRSAFNWLLSLTAVIAIVVLIMAGVGYTAAGISEAGKTAAKGQLTAVMWGIGILLGAWLLLNLINPQLVEFSFDALSLAPSSSGGGGGGASWDSASPPTGSDVSSPSSACSRCVSLRTDPDLNHVPVKAGAGDQINFQFSRQLQTFGADLDTKGIKWQVTEAYPPTGSHVSSCHGNGLCVDANLNGVPATPANIKTFLNSASAAGVGATYEVRTSAERDALIAGGVVGSNVLVNSAASAPHFHMTATP